MNRRAKFTAVALAMITIAFYVCLFAHVDVAWFETYSERVVFCLLFVVAGITATDSVRNWRNGGGNQGGSEK